MLRGYEGRLEVAAINDPDVAGAVRRAGRRRRGAGTIAERRHLLPQTAQTVAGHSAQMDPLRFDLERLLSG